MRIAQRFLLFLIFIIFPFLPANAENGHPKIKLRTPCSPYSSGQTVDISEVMISFENPVTGVQPDDLLVNGFPAKYQRILHAHQTNIMKDGRRIYPTEDTYVFTGFKEPEFGKLTITLQAANIWDIKTRDHFSGESWSCLYLNPTEDEDLDGLTNAEELKLLTKYDSKDSDDDMLPDYYEANHPCLNPIFDQRYIQTNTGETIPGDPDADDDGATDIKEFLDGTDPCS